MNELEFIGIYYLRFTCIISNERVLCEIVNSENKPQVE